MKVLFVCAGRGKGIPGNIVFNQAESLRKFGVEVDFFTILNSGILGYLKSIFILIKTIKDKKPEVVHAHYSFSGFIAGICTRKPVVVSLMGSEMISSFAIKYLIRLFSFFLWNKVIVKTTEMKLNLKLPKVAVIPNGVDLERFFPTKIIQAREKVSFNDVEKNVLFLADPSRIEKNYLLAQKAIESFGENVQLRVINNILNEMVPWYINASDVVLLTSKWEGSPNIIKEAMACNCPVVSTDVGDVRWLFGNTPGHYLTSFDPVSIAENITLAMQFRKINGHTEGRIRIIELGLDSEAVANRILVIYNNLIERKGGK